MKVRGRTKNEECLCKTEFDVFFFLQFGREFWRGRKRCIFVDHGTGCSSVSDGGIGMRSMAMVIRAGEVLCLVVRIVVLSSANFSESGVRD